MNRMAAVATERVDLCFGPVEVSLICVADLEPHIDKEGLLGTADAEEPPYWMHLWPGARTLAERLSEGGSLEGQRVCELGCGMGLPALVAARLGGRVIGSDWQHPPLAMLARSAALNRCEVGLVQMDWRNLSLRGGFDLLLGADVAYDEAEEESLVKAFADHVVRGGRLLLADSVNTYREGVREKLEDAGFAVAETNVKQEEDGRVVWVRCLEGVKR